jgi:hypothetical protein
METRKKAGAEREKKKKHSRWQMQVVYVRRLVVARLLVKYENQSGIPKQAAEVPSTGQAGWPVDSQVA